MLKLLPLAQTDGVTIYWMRHLVCCLVVEVSIDVSAKLICRVIVGEAQVIPSELRYARSVV